MINKLWFLFQFASFQAALEKHINYT